MIRLAAFADEADSNFSGQIAALLRNRIEYIELRGLDGKNISKISETEAKEYAKMLADSNISVWSIGSPIGKVDITVDFNEYLSKVKRICQIAIGFNADKIRAFSFFNSYDSKQEVLARLQAMVDVCNEYNIAFCHENEKEIYGDTVERVLEIANNVKGIKLVYDPANYLQCGEDAKNALISTVNYTKYFHIKDVNNDGLLVPSGYGNGDIEGLIKTIGEKDAVLTLEPHLKVFDGYANIDDTEMKTQFTYASNNEAFDCAVNSLKNILQKLGYKYQNGGYVLCK